MQNDWEGIVCDTKRKKNSFLRSITTPSAHLSIPGLSICGSNLSVQDTGAFVSVTRSTTEFHLFTTRVTSLRHNGESQCSVRQIIKSLFCLSLMKSFHCWTMSRASRIQDEGSTLSHLLTLPFTRTNLGSFFLDPEDVRSLSLRGI